MQFLTGFHARAARVRCVLPHKEFICMKYPWAELCVTQPFTGAFLKIGLKAGRLRTCQTVNDSRLLTPLGECERCSTWHSFSFVNWKIFKHYHKHFHSLEKKRLWWSCSPAWFLNFPGQPSVSLYFLDILLLFCLWGQHSESLSQRVQMRTLKRLNSSHERWPSITRWIYWPRSFGKS